MEIPSFNALVVFCITARNRSISRAAEELHLTHGAVSRQVSNLEKSLGVRLFERSTRGVTLTIDGQELFKVSDDAVKSITNVINRIKLGLDRQPFHVSCERSLAMKWLIPRLHEFQQEFPDIPIHLTTGGGAVHFVEELLDVAIRRADFPFDPSWNIMPFMPEYIGPVCCPKMVDAYQRGDFVSIHTSGRSEAWNKWCQLAGDQSPKGRQQKFDHFFLCLEAAISGLGVAILPFAIAIDAIQAGQLAAPRGFLPDGTKYVLILQAGSDNDKRIPLFYHWLKDKGSELEALLQKNFLYIQEA